MLDLDTLNGIKLSPTPAVQKVVGFGLLVPNYHLPRRVRIEFEHFERKPDGPVIFAMNHTDRYNYWPFQFRLWRKYDAFTATWVKGKYYRHPFMAWFMRKTNNIPTVSRGYIISEDFLLVTGRAPSSDEYRALRAHAEGEGSDLTGVPATVLTKKRDMLGREFDPAREDYRTAVQALFEDMMGVFVSLNRQAIDVGLNALIFPQGSRSKRLSKGHIGLAQIALKLGVPIVPVGCNGCDRVYPGSSPVAKHGRIVYRFGQPITLEDQRPFRPDEEFEPFTPSAEAALQGQFRGLTDLVMDRINDCLDPDYQYDPDKASDGVKGVGRFL